MTGNGHYLSEAGVLGQRAAWSESQLHNTIAASILRPRSVPGTTTTTEEANIVGRTVQIVANNGAIGSLTPTLEIDVSNLNGLTQEQRLALAAAEQDDVTFYADLAGTLWIDPDDPTQTVRLVRVVRSEDVDVAAAGSPLYTDSYTISVPGPAPTDDATRVWVTVSAAQASTADQAAGGKTLLVSSDGISFFTAIVLTFLKALWAPQTVFDWSGEFNSYIVPFSPFGNPTVVRSPSPHILQFLLDLGRESGADQALIEPDGELGLVRPQDPEWRNQHGGPRDPQPGNTQARRDTMGAPEDDCHTALPLSGTGSGAPAGGTTTTDVTVNTAYVSQDPSDPARYALFVGGTAGADLIEVRRGSTVGTINVVINGTSRGTFAGSVNGVSLSRVIVYGHDGNDTITVNSDLGAITAVLYGGAGDDTLRGGQGKNFLDGGDGNDYLYGGSAADLILGGRGQDTLLGGRGDDLLIGGVYLQSEDLDAVAAVLAEWTSTRTYSQRQANLRNGVGAEAFFKLNLETVLDDQVRDVLTGDLDQDWFWVFGTDATDRKGNETVN